MHASAECMPRPRPALANKAPASPASGVLEPETLSLQQTSEPPGCWNRRKLLKLALPMRDKTSLPITGKRLALPVCIPSKGAPAPRSQCQCRCRCRGTLRGSWAWGHHGSPFPLPSPAANTGLQGWAEAGSGPGGMMQWGSNPGSILSLSAGAPAVPGVGLLLRYPPPFWGP